MMTDKLISTLAITSRHSWPSHSRSDDCWNWALFKVGVPTTNNRRHLPLLREHRYKLLVPETNEPAAMASIATGLAQALPKPKHSSEHEEPRVQQRGPRIVAADQIDETQIVLRVSETARALPFVVVVVVIQRID